MTSIDRLPLVLTLVLAFSSASLLARAQDDAPTSSSTTPSSVERAARAHYAQGQAAFNAGRYEQAVTEFEAGFEAMPRPGFLLNIGHAERKRGNLRKARAAYKKFLLVDPTTDLRDDVTALLADLDSALADEDHADRAAAAAAVAPPPIPAPPVLAPVTVPAPAAALIAAPAPAEPPSVPLYRRHWVWAAAGALVIAAGAAIYLSQRSAAGDDGFRSTGSLGSVHP